MASIEADDSFRHAGAGRSHGRTRSLIVAERLYERLPIDNPHDELAAWRRSSTTRWQASNRRSTEAGPRRHLAQAAQAADRNPEGSAKSDCAATATQRAAAASSASCSRKSIASRRWWSGSSRAETRPPRHALSRRCPDAVIASLHRSNRSRRRGPTAARPSSSLPVIRHRERVAGDMSTSSPTSMSSLESRIWRFWRAPLGPPRPGHIGGWWRALTSPRSRIAGGFIPLAGATLRHRAVRASIGVLAG
jgi:hypothetical protein